MFLIIENGHNVANAAYMVVYKDGKYFRRCFKKEFGLTPSEMKKEAKKSQENILEKYNIKKLCFHSGCLPLIVNI